MFTLTDIAGALAVELTAEANLIAPLDSSSPITGVSIDSRTLKPGELFIAIQGGQFDGHDFISAAIKNGAAAVVVMADWQERMGATSSSTVAQTPVFVVPDTQQALMQLARAYRRRVSIPCVAITGSCGKTTTRALISTILNQRGPVCASIKSFNNNIGVPLTILGLTPEHRALVCEIGANALGEIAPLSELAQPTVAVLTNARGVHLTGFGDLAGVVKEKGQIFSGLPESGGVAVINADDPHATYWRACVTSPHCVITFGVAASADVTARDCRVNAYGQPEFTLVLPNNTTWPITLPLLGEHNISNALAAAAAAVALKVSAADIVAGLTSVVAEDRRLVLRSALQGATLIDDSYNANPHSVAAAIAVLGQRAGRRLLILGDMLELGQESAALHAAVADPVRAAALDHVYCYGPETQHTAAALGQCATHYADQASLIDAVKSELDKDTTVLVKGSNGMRMDRICAALIADASV